MRDSALANEVLIPLDEELWRECMQYETQGLSACGDDAKEKEVCLRRMERLFEVACKRWSQNEDMWIDYVAFERENNRFEKVKTVYNRAIHALKDVSEFEDKYNLLQAKGHLSRVCSSKETKHFDLQHH